MRAVAPLGPQTVKLSHAENLRFSFQPCQTQGVSAGLLPQRDGLIMMPCSKSLKLLLSPGERHLILSALRPGYEALRKKDGFKLVQPKGVE